MQDPRVLRNVATRALEDARAAWRKAAASSTDENVRAAMRARVFAGRALRRAAAVTPRESTSMLAAAKRTDVTASQLRDQLVGILETRRTVL